MGADHDIMTSNTNQNLYRTDLDDDDLAIITDLGMENTVEKSVALDPQERVTGDKPSGTIAEAGNPFKPRASLSRSPTRMTPTREIERCIGAEEDPLEVGDAHPVVSVEKTGAAERRADEMLTDNVLVPRDTINKMLKQVRNASLAVRAIYEYATTTKNVSRLLREKSALAIRHLESLSEGLEQTHRYPREGNAAQEAGTGRTKTGTSNTASQTEDRATGVDTRTTREVQEGGTLQTRRRTSSKEAIKEGSRLKRKERTPPEQEGKKRSRPNAKVSDNVTQPTGRGNELVRGRMESPTEPSESDLGSPMIRPPSDDYTEPMDLDAGPPLHLLSRNRRNRGRPIRPTRPTPDVRWDYVSNVPLRERSPRRPTYSETVRDERGRPYRNPLRANAEIAYLREARIPHWEWRGYSSEDLTEAGEVDLLGLEPLETDRRGYPRDRIVAGRETTTAGRQEKARVAPPKRPKRPRRRAKPEAVLVKIGEGSSYLETYKKVAGELRSHCKDVKGVRRTRTGHLLIEIGRETKVEEVAKLVRSCLGDAAQVKQLQETTTLQLRGLDPIVTKEEVAVDLAAAGKIDPAEVHVQALRPMRDGTQVGVVRVPSNKLSGELRSGRIRVGLVICRAKILPDITRCYRCHQMGHVGLECRNLEAGKSLCRKCGLEGHSMDTCENSPRCILCSREGLTGPNTRHVAGALNCPAYRERLIVHNNG